MSRLKEAEVRENLRYGPHLLNGLDLYLPSGPGPHPVLAFIHGGEFFEGDKASHQAKGRAFARAGFIFASINYRLAPSVRHPSQVEDVARALAWLRENVQSHGGDPERLFLSGHSSGAHLAALVATDARYLAAEGLRPGHLSGIVLLDGAGYDIPTRMRSASARTRKVYSNAFGHTIREWESASPTRQARLGDGHPPFLVLYAGKFPGPRAQAQLLTATLRWSGAKVRLMHFPERNHVTLEQRLGTPGDRATAAILQFLRRQPPSSPGAGPVALCTEGGLPLRVASSPDS